jgi:hypothetical protein
VSREIYKLGVLLTNLFNLFKGSLGPNQNVLTWDLTTTWVLLNVKALVPLHHRKLLTI